MESIQLAQMLADLSDLNAAQEAQAAVALVNANKPTATNLLDASQSSENAVRPPIRPGQRHHTRTGSTGSIGSTSTSFLSRTASPAKFDKYGRRILTPPNTRANSTYGSIPGTPRQRAETEHMCDEDVDRAGSLMALYEIRAKLKDQDNRSLLKLRDKIAALQQARLQQERKDSTSSSGAAGGGESSKTKYIYPKNS